MLPLYLKSETGLISSHDREGIKISPVPDFQMHLAQFRFSDSPAQPAQPHNAFTFDSLVDSAVFMPRLGR